MQQRIVPITGAAGTGKTTIIREVYTTLTDAGYDVVLCAPTGKAAKRIQEATGIPAQTIHRLLEYPRPGERDDNGDVLVQSDPRRGKHIKQWDPEEREYYYADRPIPYKVVLADEYAMVNRELHRNLIDALPPGGRLCMFGDVNQLRPIEQGKYRADAESPFQAGLRRFNGTVLTTVHRTTEGSGIAINGERILLGRVPLRRDDFVMRVTEQPVNALIEVAMDLLEKGINLGTNVGQIISATRKTWIGTYKLNIALQDLLNPIGRGMRVRLERHKWDTTMPISVGVGDKIIWTENAYDLRDWWDRFIDGEPSKGYVPTPPDKIIMNGESGVITYIDPFSNLTIDLGDRIVNVPHKQTIETKHGGLVDIDPRRTIDLGFCITTHKAQGSEWEHVVYVLNKSTMMMQCRSNFYTAISRGRKTATVIADQRSLQNSVVQIVPPIERNRK